jgi:hypothetical protein
MKEYIIHGTVAKNLKYILKSGYIEAHINKKKETMLNKSLKINQIFTQLLYRNLPNEHIQIPHWWFCCIVLDKKILKDYPFYATNIGGFYNKFSNAFSKNAKNIFVKSCGNLKKIPNLKKLKNYICKRMTNTNLGIASYMHSHEILFNKKIPLKKYCKMILYRSEIKNKMFQKIIILSKKLKIPIKCYENSSNINGYGLNNFIDLIEK